MKTSQAELEKFCDAWLALWSGNQPEKLIKFYSSDIFYLDPAHSKGIVGRNQLFNYLEKLLKKYPDWEWRRKELIPTEKGFCLKWIAKLSSGKSFEGLDIIEIREDKITRNEVFFDASLMS